MTNLGRILNLEYGPSLIWTWSSVWLLFFTRIQPEPIILCQFSFLRPNLVWIVLVPTNKCFFLYFDRIEFLFMATISPINCKQPEKKKKTWTHSNFGLLHNKWKIMCFFFFFFWNFIGNTLGGDKTTSDNYKNGAKHSR